MNRPALMLAAVAAILSLGIAGVAAYTYVEEPRIEVVPEVVAPTPVAEKAVLPYGSVTLRIGEEALFESVRIQPLAVTEDSRCPMNARCIQAGTVRVRTEIVSGMGTSTSSIELGSSITTEAEEIRLVSVSPDTMAGETISEGSYQLTFSVTKRESVVAPCYVGGCSSQICSDSPDVVSTCEWRESYACYKTATCARQANGSCGWTETPELSACLAGSGT